ncbi:hypothetical protein AAFF_G00155710 [Aldrovandia affinis]|uniref:Developmental arteries and neural crest EGF-like protein n=1 Tax=Aldrovandia affinis TaxID=143900 RepID=A0AAD7T0S1_9TELE|nr:hypothetical protein AAFF_G00155710 [Aldrovandia affinis]
MLFEGRYSRFWTFAGMLTVLTLILLCIQSGNAQTCTDGFTYDRRLRQCADVDECRTLADPCRGDMRCVNQNGGYLCIPRGMYSQSYARANSQTYSEQTYPDPSVGIPESYPNPAQRPAVPPIYPVQGRSTPCILGYLLGEDGRCTDIDECETESHQCNPTQVCINTSGGYTCTCTEGYWLISGQCQDIDECRYGYCQQLCANVPGSYSCSCNPGFVLNPDGRTCQDVDECDEVPCAHGCFNTYGSFMCNCDEGFELGSDGTTCNDLDECGFSEFLCQHLCVNTPGSFSCLCPPGYFIFEDGRSCEDINECDTGNHTCTTQQVCFNFQGGFKCLDPNKCDPPYIEISENQCMCSAEIPACRDKPFTILFRHMDLTSGRGVPADIFQMQATTRYPGAFYIFQIKSGNEGREFTMRQTSNVSATLVLGRPVKGPREIILDLEMVTVNHLYECKCRLKLVSAAEPKLLFPVSDPERLSNMATDYIKNCCKIFLREEKESTTQVVKMRVPPVTTAVSGVSPEGPTKGVGVSEDYLLSKLPPNGREVPFIVPIFKPSYIQPSGSQYASYQEGLQGSARCSYADRKAELTGASHIVYDPGTTFQSGHIMNYVSPGSARRVPPTNKTTSMYGSVWDLKSGKPRLSNSMFDLTHPNSHMQRYDSVSSVQSSTSSMKDSPDSCRSLESITLSGDEREQGKLSIRLSYQEALEQIWITLVQCKDVHFPVDSGGQQRIGVKGVITVSKPVHFKSSIKEASPDVEFMETFVFALHLQQLRMAGLVFRIQAHFPRKRTLGECVLSLRQLGPQETQVSLDINPPSRAPCKDVHFPVDSGGQQRIGVKGIITVSKPVHFKSSIKEASPDVEFMETFVFALHLQQLRMAGLVFRLQAHFPRKRTLGECVLSLRQLGPQETQVWLDINPPSRAPICHAELHLATCFQPVSGRIQIQVLGAQNLPTSSAPLSQSFFVRVEMHSQGRLVTKQKTRP